MMSDRIFLSPPHIGNLEERFVREVFASNWIAPLGPQVDAFEKEFAEVVGAPAALALSSGTAALHLALLGIGVERGDEVICSTFTFAASANPICYLGAKPVFVDSDRESWNMDPGLFADEIRRRSQRGRLPKAVVVVHLYGQAADLDPIAAICSEHDIPLIEDAAEALGASYRGRQPGNTGVAGIFSFNGNKVITTSGGGMLVSSDLKLLAHARKLATQARDDAPHYQHSEIGYNYRLSNVLAAIGRGQLAVLRDRVEARRRNFQFYTKALGGLPGLAFMPEPKWSRSSRWLTCVTIDSKLLGVDREQIRQALEAENIESRPVWKPMHLQPVFAGCEVIGGKIAEEIFQTGLCLPSGSNLSEADLDRVVSAFRGAVSLLD